MGTEIFNLKSLYLEDTVVRGARISTKNASSTRSIEVNPGDDPTVKTGETGVNKEYLIQSSLKGNDLNGYGIFTQNSDVIRGYTGAQNLSHSDKIKLDTDTVSYTVTGIDGTDVYIVEKYTKENMSDPDVVSGTCSIEKVILDSVKYERADENITYDKDNNEWGVTGAQMSDPVIAPSGVFEFDTGVNLQFQKGTSNKKPDVATVLSTRKTLISNNTSPVLDVSLSPMPYPHSSLQVFMGLNGSEPRKAVEAEDYMVNYTNGAELLYPIPPYEEREVAYIKFLGSMTDEVQVSSIDASFSGNMTIDKETIEGDTVVVRPVQEILSTDDFSIKVGGTEKVKNAEYISNDGAGMLTFVEHNNREELIDTLTYPKKLIWDGISVIKGVKEEDVNDVTNLVIPGVTGLKGIDYTIYFEDTDTNNLVRDVDFVIDPESGAFSLNSPVKSDEAVLVSYYVEGEDIKDEKIELDMMRLNSFPLIVDSLMLTKKYNTISVDGSESTFSKILVEGIDFKVSYVTGYIELLSSNETTVELKASYTPMAQINCVAQSISGSRSYNFTIIDDVFNFSQDDIGSKALVFQVSNPVVSVPQKILFAEDRVDSNYNFLGSILPENILSIGIKGTSTLFNIQDAKYDDVKREITLDSSLNDYAPLDGDIVVGSYTFESDILPYAPALLIYTLISAGDSYFLIEGYDKTDSLRAGTVLKVENRDPQSINYYVIKTVTYSKRSTRVDIYGTFPEDAIDPIFSIFDDQITWQDLSSDVTVDTSAPVDSNSFVFDGGPLFIQTNFKVNGLLLVNNQEIYTINSITTLGNQTTVNVYPNLRSPLTSNIKFSILPVYSEGITTLPAKKLILNDAAQPAFTLWYQSPEGFEGSAKILFVSDKIVIEESVSGVKNPVSYTFSISDYQDVYILAKTIQATASTFSTNVPDMGVPEYNPFTIVHSDKELYYLGNGAWSPSTLVPFEEEVQVSLPYTFNITPELFKYSLLEFFSGKNEVTVKDADVTTFFVPGMVVSLINKISGRIFFSKVVSTELVSDKDTKVTLSSIVLENMIAPYMFVCLPSAWLDLTNKLLLVDHDTSKLTFNGTLSGNIRVGTLLSIAEGYVYQVQEITQSGNSFELSLNSEIDSEVTAQTYSGYVKYSNVPIVLNTPGPQPRVQFNYSAPDKHVGYASVKVDINEISFREVVDNFNVKETTFVYSDYENFGFLFNDINNLESYVSGYNPFSVVLSDSFSSVLSDTFDNYALKSTGEQYVYLPSYVSLAVAAFDIDYTPPSMHGGTFSVKITSESMSIKESVIDLYANEFSKETVLRYEDYPSMSYMAETVIPDIDSVVPGYKPFYTILKNQYVFGLSKWDTTHLTPLIEDYLSGDQVVYATVDVSSFIPLGIINEKKMVLDTDYAIDNGVIELSTPVASLERYTLNYMGLDNLYENEGDSITCTCRFITALPVGYRLDVYFEYQNIDQFYIQKLTERKFSEIVTVPQVEQLIEQKGSAGGSGGDSGATNSGTPNYEGGLVDFNYLLQDEYIKKQLYLRFYKWYKQRLRGLSAELQLGLGFKFGHSNAVGVVNDYYTLDDSYVETEDYTLTKDVDIGQIDNGFSKFFPVGYSDQAPHYYDRFGKEYLSYNEVYCCNVTYLNEKNEIVTVGIVKSDRPYWNRVSDLVFKVWEDAYIETNLVGFYNVDVPLADRSFAPSNYSFLRVLDVGDKIKIEDFKNTYTISGIVSPVDRTYEYLITSKPFTDKGIKTYNLVGKNVPATQNPSTYSPLTLNSFIDAVSPDGYRMQVTRKDKEDFPMFDDHGSLGASAYGDAIARLKNSTRRIKKPFGAGLLKLLFPFITESTKNFKIMVKKDSEGQWEELGTVDLSKLTFKEERNIDDVLDALRYDFTEKFTVPIIPPYTVYDIKEDSSKGFFRYFYVDLEKIYDADSKDGYYQGLAIRAKDRNWWFKFVDGGEEPIIEDYGFDGYKVYENFYDPDNIYKRLLLEKQAWQTEELIIRDLYGFSDKLARAFYQGNIAVKNSEYQDYFVMPDGGTVLGVSDILRQRILAYEKQLRFLIDTAGPVFRTLYPDLAHAEDTASPEIATTYNQTLYAWNLYNEFYNLMWFYYNLNEGNNYTWKTEYVRWALSLERGVTPQKSAKQMYEEDTRTLTIGLQELPTINISLSSQQIYSIINPVVTVSATYDGSYIRITFDLVKDGVTTQGIVYQENLYTKETLEGIPTTVYKSISTVCSEISSWTYASVYLFSATNVFEHFENNVVSKLAFVANQAIDQNSGITLNSTNVADHRSSDPRVLFLSKDIEDRIYTHESRDLPAINLGYLGNYYFLKNSTLGMGISLYQGGYNSDLKHGVFLDDVGEKVLVLTYTFNNYNTQETREDTFKLYNKVREEYVYKTLTELSDEISAVRYLYDIVYTVDVTYTSRNLTCDTFIITPEYVDTYNNGYSEVALVFISENATYSDLSKDLDYFYYRVYKGDSEVKKLDIVFYDIIVDGSRRYKGDTISDTFTFSLQGKTLSSISSEISNFRYHGEAIFSAASIYEPAPTSSLSTSHLDINDTLQPVGSDWETILYADTYVEAVDGNDSSSRSVSGIKNAEFCFPMYTANGNPNKIAIEDIPVSGSWEETYSGDVLEIGCTDGQSWSVTFSDHESGDRKNHMAPQELMELIDNGGVLSETQYNSIKDVEDKPVVAVLKELVLTRNGAAGESTARFNLRQYSTINELIEAIVLSRFNDEGIQDINGGRKFFTASVVGDTEIQGKYKCYGLYSDYSPVVRSFDVLMDDGTMRHFYNILIGWEPLRIDLKANVKHKLRMSEKRYSYGETYKFLMGDPETAYIDTLYNYPQGFRRDILAFDIYSWDYNARYVVKNNWMYFKSDSVDYSSAADLGQPDKSLGYGIPLAGSGHALTDYRESIADLINRVNGNNVINKWFYANMKFTRDNKEDPGNFEYNYLPNFTSDVPRSTLSNIMLKDDNIIKVKPGTGYTFTSSNITVDDGADTFDIICDWKYDHTFEYIVFFNEDKLIEEVVDRINNTRAPEILSELIHAEVNISHPEWGAIKSTNLLPTFFDRTINAGGTSINMYSGVNKVEAIKLTIPALSGTNYVINNATYSIPRTRDRLNLKLNVTYSSTFTIPTLSLTGIDVEYLSNFIRSLRPYSDPAFTALFESSVLSSSYNPYTVDRLLSTSSEITVAGTYLSARLNDVVAFKVLNMTPEATIDITDSSIGVVTFNSYNRSLPNNYDLHSFIDSITGNYSTGFLSCDVLPLKIPSVGYGRLNKSTYNLNTVNTPAHVYFGVLGDIKFIQISDYNLHVQYNYLKQRLGMPWTDSQGNLEYDYFTPENFNENNPTAIDLSNFLGYLRTGRYNQIKNSLINEATVSNKYFWLYMKFHKEFGCDQRANMLKDAIEKGNTDISTLGQIL
jgi:hypothetical protein